MLPSVPVHQTLEFVVIQYAISVKVGSLKELVRAGLTFVPVKRRVATFPRVLHFMSAKDLLKLRNVDHARTVVELLKELGYARLDVLQARGEWWQWSFEGGPAALEDDHPPPPTPI